MVFKDKAERQKLKDQKELDEYNKRQERYDDKIRDAKQKSDFKTMLAKLKFETYTKRLVAIIVAVGLIDLQLSYILAFMNKDQIAETLSGQICTTILGTAFIYMIRAYFDTKAEHNNKADDKMRKQMDSNIADKLSNVAYESGLTDSMDLSEIIPDEHLEVEENENETCG
jgi:hypothetical protein